MESSLSDDLLDRIIAFHRFSLPPPGHPDRPSFLDSLGTAVSTRFDRLGNIEDLQEAITCHRQAIDLRPPGHPDRSSSLDSLAIDVFTRFEQLGQMGDLKEAIACHHQALDLRPLGHSDRSISLTNLASAVSRRFEQLGELEDLEEAITYLREALDLPPPGHPDRSLSLNNLAIALSRRFDRLGHMADMEEAITCRRQVLDLCPPGHSDHFQSLNDLACAVATRFDHLGNMEDLEETIICHRRALDLHPPSHPNRPISLNNLASAVSRRFEQLGKMEDLEEAIMCDRQALDLQPPSHPDRSLSLNNLAINVATRFEQLENIEDLEEAIAYHREALDLRPFGHPDRSITLDNLATDVAIRFRQLGKMEDLEEAITCHRQALDLRPPGHPDHSISLNNLANALSRRFGQLKQMEDLEEAIAYHRQALDFCPPSHLHRSLLLTTLANAVTTRFEQQGNIQDLEESVKLYFDADTILPSNSARHATTRSMLAFNMLQLFHHSPTSDRALHMASDPFALFDSAAHHSTSSANARFLAAIRWVQAAQRFQNATILRVYSTALACLDRRATVAPTVSSWQNFLVDVPGPLASEAASSAIEASALETAVEFLEQGRTILWSKMQGFRHPLDKLREIDGDLADEFNHVSRELERLAMSFDTKPSPPGNYDRKTKAHRMLSERWDQVVQLIRRVKGFADFLQAVPFTSLQVAAAEGPVIIVNISGYRSDAIIIRRSDPPVLVPLPAAFPKALKKLSNDLSSALALDSGAWKKMGPILRTLWELVVSPVVSQLAVMGVVEKSRIWWCPTAQLCTLPLHSAGPYKPRQQNLPEIYISSYTPTLSSLIRARSDVVSESTSPKLLVMGQPNDHLEKAKLPHVKEELCRIGKSVNVLIGEQANRETLLSCLQQCSWVHFACHGCLVPKEPFLSYFQLHDNAQLTLSDLMKTSQLPEAELAFLSACNSAAINVASTPDEVIHLAAGLQFCGFRSVVGTLWSMADVDGPDVAQDFYRYMFREAGRVGDFKDSAMALNHATREMRKRGVPMDRWINFVHIGA